jgi:hypothetical protein
MGKASISESLMEGSSPVLQFSLDCNYGIIGRTGDDVGSATLIIKLGSDLHSAPW